MKILVTGGAGFIGSAVVRHIIAETAHDVVVIDNLSYAADLSRLQPVADSLRYSFVHADIGDRVVVEQTLHDHCPNAVMHLAAETHVDRSIDSPMDFITANVTGTATLLEAVRGYWTGLGGKNRIAFRFHHVSTDEVFGSLGEDGNFDEQTPYDPTSPYSASKASSDHLVRAWHKTFGLPILVSNTSNNFGPYQFPEKLIPLMITKALAGEPLPIYGDGQQRREWLYVDDHAEGLVCVLERGEIGETYCLGSDEERTNLEVVERICDLLDQLLPRESGGAYKDQISHVVDRPGHDFRYRLSSRKVREKLNWQPATSFGDGLNSTVDWYLANRVWSEAIAGDLYAGQRLGVGQPNMDRR